MNIPNILTFIRLILVPVYVIVFNHEEGVKLFATLIFIVASFTDVLDGYLARRLNMSTRFGQLMDPLADKCMQLAVIITLFASRVIPLWFLILLFIKEVAMIFGSTFLYTKKTYVKSNLAGKVNTVVLFLVMTLLLLLPSMDLLWKNILLIIAACLALWAGITYWYLYIVQNHCTKKPASLAEKGESL